MSTNGTTIEPPGPGFWRLDDSHMPDPLTRQMWEIFVPLFQAGVAECAKRYGMLLEGFDIALVAGRGYMRARPIGAPPPKAGKKAAPPPKLLLKVLFLVHPELRRRRRRAEEVLAKRLWRDDVVRWQTELRERFRGSALRVASVDAHALDDAALAVHIVETRRVLHEGGLQHFRHCMAYGLPVGDYLHHACAWTGLGHADVLAALRGASPASADTVALLDRLADAVDAAPAARAALEDESIAGDAKIERLRSSSPAVATALGAYLAEHGLRVVTGFDLTHLTLREMPRVVVSTIRARLDARRDDGAVAAGARAAERVREKVPADRRAEYDALLEEARYVYGLRDDDVGPTFTWPLGVYRIALLEAARRLVSKGRLLAIDNVFDTSPTELDAILAGAAEPTAEEVASRTAERERLHSVVPPLTLGPEDGPPPADALPPACARLFRAMDAYLGATEQSSGPRPETRANELAGHGVSAGRYEGRARVVVGPRDFEKIGKGDVLVAKVTSPVYNVLLPLLGAVVTDRGGALCHAAIVAREFGIPGVVGTRDATTKIPDGARVRVDGDAGTVEICA
jgi:pyruvate,water dikinase